MLNRTIPAGDIDLVDGSPVLLTGAAYYRQKIASRFKFFLGEWFLDQREGVPYFRDVFVHNPDIRVVRSVFRSVLLSIKDNAGNPIVASILKFDLSFDSASRQLAFDFAVTFDTGAVLDVAPSDDLFIITVSR